MDIPRKLKPEKVVSKDESRPALCSPVLFIEGEGDERVGILSATNSYAGVIVPVHVDKDDVEGHIHPLAIKFARAHGERKSPIKLAARAGEALAAHIATFVRPDFRTREIDMRTIVDWNDLLSDHGDSHEVTINVGYLKAVAEAMGSDIVTLRINRPRDPIIVIPAVDNGGVRDRAPVGVVMPTNPTSSTIRDRIATMVKDWKKSGK